MTDKMAVRTQCPRCKQPLSVPNKLAGSYASCPRCQGRFWVSKDAPLDPSVSDSGGSPVGRHADVDASARCHAARAPRRRAAPAPLRRLSAAAGIAAAGGSRAAAGPAAAVLSLGNAAGVRCRSAAAAAAAAAGRPGRRRRAAGRAAAGPQGRAAGLGRGGPIDLETGRRRAASPTPTPGRRQEGQRPGQIAIDSAAGHDRGLDLVGGDHGCHRDDYQRQWQFERHHAGEEGCHGRHRRAVLRQSRAGRTASLSAVAAQGPPGPCPRRLQGRTAILQAGPRSVAHGDLGRLGGAASRDRLEKGITGSRDARPGTGTRYDPRSVLGTE